MLRLQQGDRPLYGCSPSWVRAAICAALALIIAGAGTPLAAQNLISNGSLDTTLDDWNTGGSGTVHDDTNDADGAAPASGSARWEAVVAGPVILEAELLLLRQCVSGIVPGATYEFGGQVLNSLMAVGGSTNIVVNWTAGTDCTGSFEGADTANPITGTGAWAASTGSAVAPPDAGSAELIAVSGIAPIGPGPATDPPAAVDGTYIVNIDNLFLINATQVPTMSAIWWGLLGLALLAISARRLRPVGE